MTVEFEGVKAVAIVLKDIVGQRAPNLMQFHHHCHGGAVSGVCSLRHLGFLEKLRGSETLFAPFQSFI